MAVDPRPAPFEGALPAGIEQPLRRPRWYHKAGALLAIVLCFEIGTFLLFFPWVELWRQSLFAGLGPAWYELWNSPYLRGAVSGLGLLNLAIGFSELFRLRRFASKE